MLLTIQNIQKYFGAELCLRNISCVLDAQDRAGIIGENGAGKTTLIKIITGELYPDDGIVTLAHGATVGYLEQNSVLDPACTVYGEMENAFRSVLDAMDEMKHAVRAGYWNLLRYNPALIAEGKNPLTIDSPEPQGDYRSFLMGEVRYNALTIKYPERAEELFAEAERSAKRRYAGLLAKQRSLEPEQ